MNWKGFTDRSLVLPGEIIPGAFGYRRVSADEYHAFPAINAGLMKKTTAAEMFQSLVTPHKDTDALTVGTLTHMAALEPQTAWSDRFALAEIPINPTSGKPYGKDSQKGAAAWELAQLMHPGKIVVTGETLREYLATCTELQRALHANPDAMTELEDVHTEVSGILWHPRWNCWVKWRPDIVPRHCRHIADVKTYAHHPATFGKEVWKRGYHIQAAWYTELHECLTAKLGLTVSKFTFLVLSKSTEGNDARPAMCRAIDLPMQGVDCTPVRSARNYLGIPEGFSRVDTFLDCLRNYIEAGEPEPTKENFELIRSLWPAYENEAGEKGRWVLAD